jgi:Zn-dependent protease
MTMNAVRELTTYRCADGVTFSPADTHVVAYNAATDRYFRLAPAAAALAQHLDAGGAVPEGENAHALLTRLLDLGLLTTTPRDASSFAAPAERRRYRSAGVLSFRFALWRPANPAFFLRIATAMPAFAWLAAFALALGVSAAALLDIHGAQTTTLGAPLTPRSGAMVAVLAAATLVLHELGHGIVLAWRGGLPRAFGVGALYGLPIAYCDVTDSWRLPRRRDRVAVALGGVAAQVLCSGLASAVYVAGGPNLRPVLGLYLVGNVFAILANLVPFIPLDGYWLLASAVDRPRLREQANRVFDGCTRWLIHAAPRPRQWRATVLLLAFRIASLVTVTAALIFGVLRYRVLAEFVPGGSRIWASACIIGLAWACRRLYVWLVHVTVGASAVPVLALTVITTLPLGLLLTLPRVNTTAALRVETNADSVHIAVSPAVRALIPSEEASARFVARQGVLIGATPWFTFTPPAGERWPLDARTDMTGRAMEVRLRAASPARLAWAAILHALA